MRTLKDLLKRLLCWALLLALLVLAAAGTVLGVQGWKLYRGTQPELPAAQLYETLSARPGFTTCDAIPQTYIDAVIAVEDSRFELHHGVDPVAIVRALWTDLRTRSLAEGGSTLTQQLAKNIYFTQEKHGRMRPAGGPAQCAVRLLAPFQPGAGAQALAGGAGPDGLLQKAHKDPGQRAAG